MLRGRFAARRRFTGTQKDYGACEIVAEVTTLSIARGNDDGREKENPEMPTNVYRNAE